MGRLKNSKRRSNTDVAIKHPIDGQKLWRRGLGHRRNDSSAVARRWARSRTAGTANAQCCWTASLRRCGARLAASPLGNNFRVALCRAPARARKEVRPEATIPLRRAPDETARSQRLLRPVRSTGLPGRRVGEPLTEGQASPAIALGSKPHANAARKRLSLLPSRHRSRPRRSRRKPSIGRASVDRR